MNKSIILGLVLVLIIASVFADNYSVGSVTIDDTTGADNISVPDPVVEPLLEGQSVVYYLKMLNSKIFGSSVVIVDGESSSGEEDSTGETSEEGSLISFPAFNPAIEDIDSGKIMCLYNGSAKVEYASHEYETYSQGVRKINSSWFYGRFEGSSCPQVDSTDSSKPKLDSVAYFKVNGPLWDSSSKVNIKISGFEEVEYVSDGSALNGPGGSVPIRNKGIVNYPSNSNCKYKITMEPQGWIWNAKELFVYSISSCN